MINNKISGTQAAQMMILFVLGSSLVTGGSMIAKQDSWASILLAAVMALPIAALYGNLNKISPGKDLFDMAYDALGKVSGAAVTLLFCLYTAHLGALVIKNFTEYFQVVSIPETPQIVTALCIGLLAYYNVVKGLETLARGAVFIMPVAMATILLLNLLSINNMEVKNLEPVFNQDIELIFSGAYSSLTFPFAETVMFITVFSIVQTKKNPVKYYLAAVIFSGILLALLVAVAIMVLGFPLVSELYFPSYSAAGVIDVGNFVSRIEVLVSGNYIIFGVVKVTVCLFVCCKGLSKVFKFKKTSAAAAPVIAVMIIASQLLYENTMQMFAFIDIYKYYAPFFELVIPLAVFIVLKTKQRGKNQIQTSQG